MPTNRKVIDFKIHNLTEEQFQELKEAGQIDPNAIYCTPDETVANFEELNERIDTANERIDTANEQINTKQDVATAINYGHVTNCITEIPQDIKLELNNGTLTLKAGSKVYVPNGFESDGVTPKFDIITIASDLTNSDSGNSRFMFYDVDTNEFRSREVTNSGTSDPATPATAYYDTGNNIINYYTMAGVKSTVSFPICIVSGNSSVASIDQVFNGFGYIGSTVFALPGVKGLIPNGRNADGSLNNIEVTTPTIRTMTMASYMASRNDAVLTIFGNSELGGVDINQNTWGTVKRLTDIVRPSYYACYYCLEDNLVHYFNGSGNESIRQCGFVGYFNVGSNNKITQFTPKTIFHAVDYNDLTNISKNIIAIAAPAGIVAAFAGSTPPSGWLKCDGSAISRTTYAKLFAAIGSIYGTGDGSTTFNLPTQSVLPLGTSAPVSLTANGTLQIKNSVGGFENVVKSAGGDNAARRELVVNADANGQNGVVQYGSGITGTANLANATGAKAIVCIKY